MSHVRRDLGRKGELVVADFLKKEGFSILELNYKERGGEIDIIAKKNEVLAFIEVKLRQRIYCYASEIITFAKRRKIIKTALSYVAFKALGSSVYRFDVALVELDQGNYTVTYFPNAFTAEVVL
jgi:putative endonuclease